MNNAPALQAPSADAELFRAVDADALVREHSISPAQMRDVLVAVRRQHLESRHTTGDLRIGESASDVMKSTAELFGALCPSGEPGKRDFNALAKHMQFRREDWSVLFMYVFGFHTINGTRPGDGLRAGVPQRLPTPPKKQRAPRRSAGKQ